MYEAAFQAVAHLRSLGHTNLMYVGDIHVQRGFALRWHAFCQAMSEAGTTVDPHHHSISARKSRPDWLEELKEKLLLYKPTAIICGIDGEAAPVYRLCIELGLRIPEDLSFVAFLNEQPMHSPMPLFTRPLLPIRETGYRAADRMLWRMANPSLPFEHIRIQCDFFNGETTRKLE
ncbi:substrate-binding domain-containing protein [Paenibacillus sp. TAB 01]|uniref:substrate-binding domain-containing protein n=1 Tax=Paenibacillus sp. TAB 01 TaxID=3368988 RepID=UPI003753B39D